jgi:hypothetical protein
MPPKPEFLRDLLNLDNSPSVRVSRKKGIAKYLTEQFVSNASEAIELIEKALQNRQWRHNVESFMMIQFTVMHMEYTKKEHNEMVLNELKDESERGLDLDNISLESATVNKKSFFRIYEGVRLTEPYCQELIFRGRYTPEVRADMDIKLSS